MTCDPTIKVRKGSWDTVNGRLFNPSTMTVVVVVDYCGWDVTTCGVLPDRGSEVVADVGNYLRTGEKFFDIRIGRPLAYYDTATTTWKYWISSYTPDQTTTEINTLPSTKTGWITKQVTCKQINAGHNGLWEIEIQLAHMAKESTYEHPHAAVSIQTSSRLARAYRNGRDLIIPTRNTSNTLVGPDIGSASNGYFDPINWRNGIKSDMDVQGYRVDINAQPTTVAIEQVRTTISFVLRRPYLQGTSDNDWYVNEMWDKWGQDSDILLNKRNADALFGYDPGELVIEAVNVSSIDEQFSRVDLVLLWDEWAHFDQNAWGIDGTVPDLDELSMASSPDRPILVAETVFWTTAYHGAFALTTADFPDFVWELAYAAIVDPVP